ncbi:MAG: protein kinase domain-containing protein, partial [Gemmatimonadales bacterium]
MPTPISNVQSFFVPPQPSPYSLNPDESALDYKAPEAIHGAAGANADLWGLGVMLFEMLTGQRPFTGEVGEVIQKIIGGRYDEKPLFDKGVDRAVVRVIRKVLNKDPEQRYQTAEALLNDLEAVARRARL